MVSLQSFAHTGGTLLIHSFHLPFTSGRHPQYVQCEHAWPAEHSGIPPIGYLLDSQPMRRIVIILGIMGAAFGALTITRSTAAQLIGIAFLTVFRPLFYTAIS